MERVTIKTFDKAIDAHILKARLEDEGIECFIYDENIVTVNPLYTLAVGGIKLKINESDIEKANSILSEIDSTPFTDNNNDAIKCPRCKSTNLISDFKSMNNIGSIFATIIAFIYIVIPFYMKSVYKCKNCDCEFKLDAKSNTDF